MNPRKLPKVLWAIFKKWAVSFFVIAGVFVFASVVSAPRVFALDRNAVFVPSSPQTYDGVSDETVSCGGADCSGSNYPYEWAVYAPDGHMMGRFPWSAFGAGHTWTSLVGSAFQVAAGGAGDVHIIGINTNYDYVTCDSGTYTACLGSTGYAYGDRAMDSVFTLSSGGGGGGGTSAPYPSGSEIFGTTTVFSIVDNPTQDLFEAVLLFTMALYGVVWLLRKH